LKNIPEQKLILGKNWWRVDEVDSTNSWVKRELAKKDIQNGSVFQTTFQRNGRGQQNKRWQSEKKSNALFSVVYDVSRLDLRHLPSLNFAVSLACYDALQEYIPQKSLKIKWPNDIYFGDHKLAGILIENMIGRNHRYSIIGIGVNVNQDKFPNYLQHATSLKRITGLIIKVESVIEALVRLLNKRVNDLIEKNNVQPLREQYVSNLYQLHKNLRFEHESETHLATLVGVDPIGRIVFASDGKTSAFAHGEINITWR